jgi:cation diffusion facilitator CzcD-associated flavoprotein CzcO
VRYSQKRRAPGTTPRVAIIGGGFGGIAAAVELRKAGIETFTVFERTDGVGGVWHQNIYPGCEVDTPSHWYSFSFKRYDWERSYSTQVQLERYLNETVDEFDLRRHFRFGATVTRVVWNDAEQCHTVELATGESFVFDVVLSAIGLFNVPKYPQWPGLEDFTGPKFHSARWEPEHDLTDKRVVLVGGGSTGTQIARAIAPQVRELTMITRDPNWISSKGEREYTAQERRRMNRPLRYRAERARRFLLEQWRFRGGKAFQLTEENRKTQALHEEYIATVFRDRPDLAAAVTPNHPFFGKRPVRATGFYETLLRDNVRFFARAVERVTPTGVVDATGEEHAADVIVMATGFRAAEYMREIEVVGRDGRTIQEVWNGEPDALLGMTVPGFPNFYMLYGPNTNLGAIVFNLETQAEYAVRDMKRMMRTGATSVEVRPSFHRVYNAWLQKRLSKTVWVDSNTYFKTETGKIVLPFCTTPIVYWALCQVLRRPSAFDRRVTWRRTVVDGMTTFTGNGHTAVPDAETLTTAAGLAHETEGV